MLEFAAASKRFGSRIGRRRPGSRNEPRRRHLAGVELEHRDLPFLDPASFSAGRRHDQNDRTFVVGEHALDLEMETTAGLCGDVLPETEYLSGPVYVPASGP